MRTWLLALTATVMLGASHGVAANPWRDLYGDLLTFDVFRNGERVGYYETRFVGKGARWRVEVQLELEVPWLFWRYRYHYQGIETWEEGRLTALEVRIEDNGEVREHRFSRQGSLLRSEKGVEAALPILATHHYDIDVVTQDRVINTLTGRVSPVRVEETGPVPFFAAGGTLPTMSYRYLGDATAPSAGGRLAGTQAWYDLEGRWVGLRFYDNRGGEIELRCRRCGLE